MLDVPGELQVSLRATQHTQTLGQTTMLALTRAQPFEAQHLILGILNSGVAIATIQPERVYEPRGSDQSLVMHSDSHAVLTQFTRPTCDI